ncbi:hypothetical protein QQ045_023295 [Rhodiola kirilowii]
MLTYLTKVDNFKSVFERKLNEENHDVTHIHPENLFVFSHLVPSYKFEGGEVDGIAKGMIELDHAALLNENPELDRIHEELEEIWAVLSSEDFMPRNYKLVEAVISENQVSVRHLDHLWVADDELRQNPANNAVAYGIYMVSETSTVMEMSRFSHVVKCQKSTNKPNSQSIKSIRAKHPTVAMHKHFVSVKYSEKELVNRISLEKELVNRIRQNHTS